MFVRFFEYIKSVWWMPWEKKPMKDVAACEKLREGGEQPMIRKCPNGETLLIEDQET